MYSRLFYLIVAKVRYVATKFWVNIGPENGMLPDTTKSSTWPVLTNYLWNLVA